MASPRPNCARCGGENNDPNLQTIDAEQLEIARWALRREDPNSEPYGPRVLFCGYCVRRINHRLEKEREHRLHRERGRSAHGSTYNSASLSVSSPRIPIRRRQFAAKSTGGRPANQPTQPNRRHRSRSRRNSSGNGANSTSGRGPANQPAQPNGSRHGAPPSPPSSHHSTDNEANSADGRSPANTPPNRPRSRSPPGPGRPPYSDNDSDDDNDDYEIREIPTPPELSPAASPAVSPAASPIRGPIAPMPNDRRIRPGQPDRWQGSQNFNERQGEIRRDFPRTNGG